MLLQNEILMQKLLSLNIKLKKKIKYFIQAMLEVKVVLKEIITKYLVFQTISRYFKISGKYILSWKYKGLSDETIMPHSTSDKSITLLIDYFGTKIRLKLV